METKHYRYCSGRFDLGQIVAAQRLSRHEEPGAWMVVTDVSCANWRGEDADVYGHIEYWYSARPASDDEARVGTDYSAAQAAWSAVLKSLGNPSVASVDEAGIHTPTLKMLDSYDDRFDGSSKTIPLTSQQFAVYQTFASTLATYNAAVATAASGLHPDCARRNHDHAND